MVERSSSEPPGADARWPGAPPARGERHTITAVDVERHERAPSSHLPSAPGDAFAFLREHPPFDTLDAAEVERVAAAAEVEFHLAGTTIFSQGAEPVEYLRVVRSGAVEVVHDGRVLDMLGEGELFGHASMLSGLPPGFAARALEDTLCYRIPEAVARVRPRAARRASRFVARSLLEMQAQTLAGPRRAAIARDPARQPVAALLRCRSLLCPPETTIREAAAAMTAAPRDVGRGRARRLARDRHRSRPALARRRRRLSPRRPGVGGDVARRPTPSRPTASPSDVLLDMLDRGFRHFPVVSAAGRCSAWSRTTTCVAVETRSSFFLRQAIARAGSVAELASGGHRAAPDGDRSARRRASARHHRRDLLGRRSTRSRAG